MFSALTMILFQIDGPNATTGIIFVQYFRAPATQTKIAFLPTHNGRCTVQTSTAIQLA